MVHGALSWHSAAIAQEHEEAGQTVQQRRQGRGRLLKTQEPSKWPLPMKLRNSVAPRLIQAHCGPHALIAAVITTCPACERHVMGLSGLKALQPDSSAVDSDALLDTVPVNGLLVPL